MPRTRITDTARLDWLAQHKAEVAHIPSAVGPGWVREEGWRVRVGGSIAGAAKTLRGAVDVAMTSSQRNAEVAS